MGIKYAVNEKFFENWSQAMAYILGYWYADGSLENASYLRGKYIRISSVDEETIINIKRQLGSKHTIVKLKPRGPYSRKEQYFLRIGSHKLYDSLVALGLCPKKSLIIRLPRIPRQFLKDFARGYLDGDGCVFLYKIPGIKKEIIVKKLSVIFTSGSRLFLEDLRQRLGDELELGQNKVYKGARAYQLRYSTRDSIKLFEFLYGGCLQGLFLRRKLDVFICYYQLRPEMVSLKAARIIADLVGHVAK